MSLLLRNKSINFRKYKNYDYEYIRGLLFGSKNNGFIIKEILYIFKKNRMNLKYSSQFLQHLIYYICHHEKKIFKIKHEIDKDRLSILLDKNVLPFIFVNGTIWQDPEQYMTCLHALARIEDSSYFMDFFNHLEKLLSAEDLQELLTHQDLRGNTILFAAAKHGYKDILKLLAAVAGSNGFLEEMINIQNHQKINAVNICAQNLQIKRSNKESISEYIESIILLLNNGAEANTSISKQGVRRRHNDNPFYQYNKVRKYAHSKEDDCTIG